MLPSIMLRTRTYLLLELFALMIALPVALYVHTPGKWLLPILWLTALYAATIHHKTTGQKLDWNRAAVTRAALKPILLRFAISAVLLTIGVAALMPEGSLFHFMRTRPAFWAMVMVLYPILSAAPQEVVFRTFFFARYRTLFSSSSKMIIASAVAFGFAHIFFHNGVAPVLCFIGGMFFARTYAEHKSLLLVTIEHALYGCFIFTVGLGIYFYHGAIQ